jgi:hypothetical protein
MGLLPFQKSSTSNKNKSATAAPPPVFSKHETDKLLRTPKQVAPKRASFTGGTKTADLRKMVANSNFVIPPFAGSTGGGGSRGGGGASLSDQGSFIEEEIIEEEIIEEFEYIEEEIIEEEVVEPELPPRKITIRFDEFDEMQTTLHINDYSKSEINKSWFDREDYDKMVKDSRKVAEKFEKASKELKAVTQKHKSLDNRGLEAWTTIGANKAKLVKQHALDAVWNEQSRQWDAGEKDPEKIREAYEKVSKGSQSAATDRGLADWLAVKELRQMEQLKEEMKQKRNLLGKSKALVGGTVRKTAGGVRKTGKILEKGTKATGKVALKTTKKVGQASVATATLDRKMLMDAIKIEKKSKREAMIKNYKQPSRSRNLIDEDVVENSPSNFDESVASIDSATLPDGSTDFKKAQEKIKKLKLLGVVPIPGTQKKDYSKKESNLDRRGKMERRPSWEAGLSAGKY